MIKLIMGHFSWVLNNIYKVLSKLRIKSPCVYPLILHDIPDCDRGRLERLLDILQKQHTFISPDNFESYLNKQYHPKKNQLLLTFDDGYYSNYIVAKEILKSRNIKAIFFIATGFIDSTSGKKTKAYINENFFNNQVPTNLDINNMKPMTWDNISELIDLGHTIGAHTENHFSLTTLADANQLNDEIILSGEKIEKRLGISIDHFAFPFGSIGSINAQAMRVAKEKYKYIHSGVRGQNKSNTNPLAIRREAINILDEFNYNQFLVSGGLSFYYWRDRILLDKMVSSL